MRSIELKRWHLIGFEQRRRPGRACRARPSASSATSDCAAPGASSASSWTTAGAIRRARPAATKRTTTAAPSATRCAPSAVDPAPTSASLAPPAPSSTSVTASTVAHPPRGMTRSKIRSASKDISFLFGLSWKLVICVMDRTQSW